MGSLLVAIAANSDPDAFHWSRSGQATSAPFIKQRETSSSILAETRGENPGDRSAALPSWDVREEEEEEEEIEEGDSERRRR